MSRERLYDRYRELQSYVGWTAEDAQLVAAIAPRLEPHLPPLVDDFYAEIDRHANTRHVITGGQKQIDRLKGSLLRWIRELLFGPYDEAYVERRWRVGVRHVEIGLDQVYANAALARLRTGMIQAVHDECAGEPHVLRAAVAALNKLLDLDLAIIEEAYQGEYVARLEQAEEGRLALMKVRSEATFRHLVETAECMIVILRPDYSIDYFSPFAERLTGFPAAQVRGCNFLAAFLLEEDRPAGPRQADAGARGLPRVGLRAQGRLPRWVAALDVLERPAPERLRRVPCPAPGRARHHPCEGSSGAGTPCGAPGGDWPDGGRPGA